LRFVLHTPHGTQPFATSLPHNPAQQALSAPLYRNKYEKLATNGFGARNAFQRHCSAKKNAKPSCTPKRGLPQSINALPESNPPPSPQS
jgi:hypothetical protein